MTLPPPRKESLYPLQTLRTRVQPKGRGAPSAHQQTKGQRCTRILFGPKKVQSPATCSHSALQRAEAAGPQRPHVV